MKACGWLHLQPIQHHSHHDTSKTWMKWNTHYPFRLRNQDSLCIQGHVQAIPQPNKTVLLAFSFADAHLPPSTPFRLSWNSSWIQCFCIFMIWFLSLWGFIIPRKETIVRYIMDYLIHHLPSSHVIHPTETQSESTWRITIDSNDIGDRIPENTEGVWVSSSITKGHITMYHPFLISISFDKTKEIRFGWTNEMNGYQGLSIRLLTSIAISMIPKKEKDWLQSVLPGSWCWLHVLCYHSLQSLHPAGRVCLKEQWLIKV